jgi:5,10-methylenetetrahydromethanopterin reductase
MPDGPTARVAELARLAEDLGAARCLVYDEGLHTRDVYVTLAAVVAATERVPVGPGITNPFVRHPGATASAIATLDEASGGRAFLGLGAGGGLTLGPLAIERRRPVASVEAMVVALRRLFAGERVDHDGPTFAFRGAHLDYGRAGIEIVCAGRGPRMTALGGRLADGFNLSYIHKDLLGDHVRALRAAAGDRPFRVGYSTMIATTEADLETARAQLSFRLVDSPPEVKERLGMTPDDTAAIRAGLADGGPAAAGAAVRPEWVPAFVIAGEPAACRDELHHLLAEADIDEYQLPLASVDGAAERIEATAALLAPA